jgi:hypothetical protein
MVASNNQCNLNALNSTISYNTTSITVTLDLTFNGSFAGTKNIYAKAGAPGFSPGWTLAGTWTVTGGSPTADSASPSSGAGSTNRFTFTGSDSVTQTNITGMTMLLTSGAPTNVANACYLVYDRNAGTIGLYNDSGTALVGTKGIGFSTLLKNSQCSVVFHNAGLQWPEDRVLPDQRSHRKLRDGAARHMDRPVDPAGCRIRTNMRTACRITRPRIKAGPFGTSAKSRWRITNSVWAASADA